MAWLRELTLVHIVSAAAACSDGDSGSTPVLDAATESVTVDSESPDGAPADVLHSDAMAAPPTCDITTIGAGQVRSVFACLNPGGYRVSVNAVVTDVRQAQESTCGSDVLLRFGGARPPFTVLTLREPSGQTYTLELAITDTSRNPITIPIGTELQVDAHRVLIALAPPQGYIDVRGAAGQRMVLVFDTDTPDDVTVSEGAVICQPDGRCAGPMVRTHVATSDGSLTLGAWAQGDIGPWRVMTGEHTRNGMCADAVGHYYVGIFDPALLLN